MKSRYVLTKKPIEHHKAQGLLLNDKETEPVKANKSPSHNEGLLRKWGRRPGVNNPASSQRNGFFVLQILASMTWILGHLDFTQAFHSGERIQRELYAKIPFEGIPGIHPRQLLRLKKTGYSLTDGPYAWYCHISRVLQELGYERARQTHVSSSYGTTRLEASRASSGWPLVT